MRGYVMELGNLGFSEEQIEILDVATNFCRDKSPIEKVRKLMESAHGFDRNIWYEMAELGWFALAIPETYGGIGLSIAEAVPIAEQMGRHLMASPFAATTISAQAILTAGSEVQKTKYLPMIAAGSIATLALSESNGDWDLRNIEASANLTGDKIKMKGMKQFSLWADSADLIMVSVKLDGEVRLLMIEKNQLPDTSLRQETIIDETKRSFSIKLDDIIVSSNAILSTDNHKNAFEQIELTAALLQSAEMCGGSQSVIDYTVDYLKTRKQFGKVIGEYQALKHPAVDAYVSYEKARSHLYSAAYNHSDQGVGEIAIRMAKASSDNAYSNAADRAIQFHGGFGFTHDCDAGLHRRAAIFHASQYGDAAWHRSKLSDLIFG